MNMFFYFPDKTEVIKSSNATEFYIPYKKEKSVHGIFFQKDKPRASIFILHGNGGNLTGWQSVAEMLWEDGYQTFIFDYPEYGNSDGQARHDQVIESSQKAFDYFKDLPEVQGTKKIVMGFSLGGNMALKIGHDNQESLDAMVLEGAFTNHRDIGIYTTPKVFRFAPWLVLGSKFKGEELIKDWKKPLLVVHSTEDKVCPYEMGKEIYTNAGSAKKELWTIKGAHLQGFGLDSETYFAKIRKLIAE
ncbi:MAG: alpha/beta fold hydrolase [Crocinitomicaceae bacterium]|nr:alpha/beta fold hydrolase [Crocinitomicaceae bacterium]